ncbi:MAG: cadmium-translocating P-type ATPase [Acidobacteria bacterium]|jgi:Cu2+-exporting ATPase/Cu+-exporting ATPase|nr:MAG: cadmium-translocating P-type ATPase [Acidobacteriota bacterium]
MRAVLRVSGMTCVNCARAIELSLKRLKGVKYAQASFELGRVTVDFNEELLDVEQIKKVIQTLGYRVEGVKGSKTWRVEILIFCWLASLLLMALMLWHSPLSFYLQALISLMVQAVGGYSFYRGALGALKARVGNMDLLISLGSTGALLYSLLALVGWLHGSPFFETSALLITFVRTGKFLEEWVKAKALKSLRDLFSLQTLKVRVLRDGREELKGVDEVFVGDTIVLRAGDMVPLDCKLVESSLEVDESLLTGESLPVNRVEGERLLSGSLVVSGYAKARVEKTFHSSYANLLVKLVEETLSQKPKVQRLADRFSHYFVQFVLLLSLAVFALWLFTTGDIQKAVGFSIAVLVVSCPCAFGIAVPLAITVGLLRSYKKGILVRNPSTLERSIGLLVLDKTGTLTEGKPRLVNYMANSEKALELACSLANVSNHPYSKALRDLCQEKGLKTRIFEGCEEVVGEGVRCGKLFLGRFPGKAQLYLIENGHKLAEFYFEDQIREEAKEVVDFLRSKGIKLVMLTGDAEDRAREIAQRLGIEEYVAQAKPEDKLRAVEDIKRKGIKVGVVGDGINDAPAMASADLSFAIGSGADITKRVGDVVLLKGIGGLVDFFKIRERTIRRVKENLFWAFVYNLLGIPIAGGLLYHKGIYLKPEMAGLMMALSSLSVVLNSIRR